LPKPPLRKILTNEERQKIYQYHKANPSAKQTEIGGKTELESSLLHFANFCYSEVWG
jgi:predicted transcriptional regulator